VFDVQKDNTEFKGMSVVLGGSFALQFQSMDQWNGHHATTSPTNLETYNHTNVKGYRLYDLENNMNLPTANMTIGAQLADGVRLHLELYLSARHHNETWVKGGYVQIDKLDFIKKDFLADFMKYATFKIGQMENNYGDAHFRRSDNGNTLYNPFIENNIMDAFITEPGLEMYYNRSGFVSMVGVTNSKLNQNVKEIIPSAVGQNTTISPTILAKLGFDKQINEDLRVRLTGSYYHVANLSSNLYSSDRAGSHIYGIFSHPAYTNTALVSATNTTGSVADNFDPTANPYSGRFNPAFGNWATSYMINPFVKYKDLEFFSTIEIAQGGDKKGINDTRTVNQYVGDVLYRFGNSKQFYIGAKYGMVTGKLSNADAKEVTINRLESGLGWFITKNMLTKLAYINQQYKDFAKVDSKGTPNDLYNGKFSGLMFEATITF
jgi:hypothetical protein